jgi:hypothetical protein
MAMLRADARAAHLRRRRKLPAISAVIATSNPVPIQDPLRALVQLALVVGVFGSTIAEVSVGGVGT